MERIEWSHELELGHLEIDLQHRHMIAIFNAVQAAVYGEQPREAVNMLLDELLRASKDNFDTEEAMMDALPPSPELDVHRGIHRGLLRELQDLRDELEGRSAPADAKTVNFLRKWLVDHMLHSDRDLVELARKA